MKVAWIDCETTGLDPQKHGIIQLALIVEIDHAVVERAEFMMNPVGKEFDEGALRINGYTKEALDAYPPSLGQKAKIEEFFAKFVEKFDKNDKFIAAGYNVAFDLDFLKQLWQDSGDKYFYSWFEHAAIDVYEAHRMLEWIGVAQVPENRKLETLAKMYGIPITAHDAAADIEATRQIAEKIRENFGKGEKV